MSDADAQEDGGSDHVGPIVFADGDARRSLQQSGDVVTFRVSERTTGDTWWRESRTGEKMGDCRVECMGPVDPSDRSVLMAYYREAGFDSVSDWQDAIEDLNGELAEGYLYRVTSDERWAECESCHEYSPEVKALGQPDYVWLCPECREPTEDRELVTDGGVDQSGDGVAHAAEEDFEREWNDLSEKVILAQILAEQQRTNLLLEQTLADGTRDAHGDASAETHRCTKCGVTVDADGRERHARAEHNAPPGIVAALFEEVEG